jgi:hypothetical protein
MKTISGKHIIIDITDPTFCPGKLIPKDFDTTNGVWFFQPTEWEAPAWGFLFIQLGTRGFPMAYSPGYSTPEEALETAEKWEIEREKKHAMSVSTMDFLDVRL